MNEAQTNEFYHKYNDKKKDGTVAFMLWFFLAGFAAHRFYLGQSKRAVSMLLLGWLTLFIWPLIDGIVMLANKDWEKVNKDIEQEIKQEIEA